MHATMQGNIHIWYHGKDTNTTYKWGTITWKNEDHPTANFFYNDGTIVPVGWFTPKADKYGYLEATTGGN